jgi:hypothetical protein
MELEVLLPLPVEVVEAAPDEDVDADPEVVELAAELAEEDVQPGRVWRP